jgi:circadian clock protein KaiC
MRSIGVDLDPLIKEGILQFHAARPTQYGLEMHLLEVHRRIDELNPRVVVVDPITDLLYGGTDAEIRSMLMRLIDFLKSRQTTALFTSLNSSGGQIEQSEVGVSSLIDTWIVLREVEIQGERNRGIYVLKSRGMNHSNQIRELLLTRKGIRILPADRGLLGVLAESARFDKHTAPAPAVKSNDEKSEGRRISVRGSSRMAGVVPNL